LVLFYTLHTKLRLL